MTRHGARAPAPIAAAAFMLPALGFALGPIFEKHAGALAGRRRARRLPRRHLRARRSSRSSPGIGEAGKTTVYVRKRNPKIDTEPARPVQPVHRDLHALHAPRLPGALRRGRRALHLPVPRRRLRLPRARSPAARRCARSTASTRACATASVEIGPRYSVNSELQALLAARPGRAARRHRPVPLPVALLDPRSCQGRRPCPSFPRPRSPKL